MFLSGIYGTHWDPQWQPDTTGVVITPLQEIHIDNRGQPACWSLMGLGWGCPIDWGQNCIDVSICPDSNVHGANMGPIWGRQDPDGPHVGPMNFAIWVVDCKPGACPTLKLKYRFDKICITGSTKNCQNDNCRCSQWWEFHQNDNFFYFSVLMTFWLNSKFERKKIIKVYRRMIPSHSNILHMPGDHHVLIIIKFHCDGTD